jgi:hypothetical protein
MGNELRHIRRDRYALLRRRLEGLESVLGLKSPDALDDTQKAFANRILERRAELKQAEAPGSDDLVWHAWAEEERACKPLFAEALAWLQANSRRALEPTGPAMLAHVLVRDLNVHCQLGVKPTIAPDVDDLFNDFVGIIRIRFPPGEVWNVPIVAHEFGHLASFSLKGSTQPGAPAAQNAFYEFQSARLSDKKDWTEQQRNDEVYRLNEFFADIFATYTLGPAFAMSALLYRFDVAQAYDKGDPRHPSYAERAAAILEAMAKLSLDDTGLMRVTEWLSNRWNGLLAFAESKTDIEDAKVIGADLLDSMVEIAPDGRYRGWPKAIKPLLATFMEAKKVESPLSSRDLLNAAWLARAHGQEPSKVADRAQDLWRQYCHE